jgi:hypothetical protein
MIKAIPATIEGLRLWYEVDGKCSGCIQGAMDAQDHKTLQKPGSYEVGKGKLGDIASIGSSTEKVPFLLVGNVSSKCSFGIALTSRTGGHLRDAFKEAFQFFIAAKHNPVDLLHDREGALAPDGAWVREMLHMELRLTAAGQKVPQAEALIKDKARSILCGVQDNIGYTILKIKLVVEDAIKVIQRTPKLGEQLSPLDKFNVSNPYYRPVNWERDFRVKFGEPVIVYRPKRGATRTLKAKGAWAVVLWRSMNGSGIIGVQIVSTGRFAHRIKFERTRVPNTVLARIKELAGDIGPIVLEDDAVSFNDLISYGVALSDSTWGSEFKLSSDGSKALAIDEVKPTQPSEIIVHGDRDDGSEANTADNERKVEVLRDQGPSDIEVEAEVVDKC